MNMFLGCPQDFLYFFMPILASRKLIINQFILALFDDKIFIGFYICDVLFEFIDLLLEICYFLLVFSYLMAVG